MASTRRVPCSIVALLVLVPSLVLAQSRSDTPRVSVGFLFGVDPVFAGAFNRQTETSGLFGTDTIGDATSIRKAFTPPEEVLE
jgi:hypothetical protein